MRLHLLAALDGTPRAATLWSPDRGEREVAIGLLARGLHGGETVIAGKGHAGHEFHTVAAQLGATIVRPNRKTEPGQAPVISGVRQRVESIIQSTKSTLGLERHGARTLHNLRAGSASDCSHSPPASPSTTNSDAPAATSSLHHLTVASVI